jgi:histone acetyltransferase (RNA polymerase elongator complex component)
MIVPIFLPHLGCHERCTYCNQQYITDLRDSDLQAVIAKSLGVHEGPFEVGLFGGNIFGTNPYQLQKLFSYFEAYMDRITNFRISTKPVPLKKEIIDILKVNRVTVIELGIPTFNNKILSQLNRRHTAQDLSSTHTALVKEGFQVALQFMVGLPDETMSDIQTTVQNMIRLKPHYIRIYPLIILEDTDLGGKYKEHKYLPVPFEEALDRTVFLYLHALKHGIKVIKMGLTENEIIKEKILAGQYHPAYGYMVKSRAFYLAIIAKLCAVPVKGNTVTIHLNHRDIPHLLGNKRMHVTRFEEEDIHIQWEKTAIDRDNFILHYDAQSVIGNIFDALEMFR